MKKIKCQCGAQNFRFRAVSIFQHVAVGINCRACGAAGAAVALSMSGAIQAAASEAGVR